MKNIKNIVPALHELNIELGKWAKRKTTLAAQAHYSTQPKFTGPKEMQPRPECDFHPKKTFKIITRHLEDILEDVLGYFLFVSLKIAWVHFLTE